MKYRVELTKWAQKALEKVPAYIADKLLNWAADVEDRGLVEVRKIPGYHDEPLRGARKGQRSLRLSRSYRALYIELEGEIVIVQVIEVTKHDY